MGKCAMWGPSGLPADLDLPEEMERPEEGVVVLGVPIGSEAFTTAAVRAKLEIHVQHLDTLPQLRDSQVALPMLTRCYVQRPSYLARTVAPLPAEIGLFRAFDERMLQEFASILAHPSFSSPEHSLAQSQVRLPISMGGVGLRSVAETAPAAFLGGWALVASRVAECFRTATDTRHLSEAIGAVQTEDYGFQQRLRTAVGLLPPAGQEALGFSSWAAGLEMDVQSQVTAVLDEARQSELREQTQTPEGRARLLSVAGPGAGQWLVSTPLLHILRIEHSLFQTALTMLLGLPHPVLAGIGRCACRESLESDGASGRHFLRCSTGPERTAVHDRVRDAVYGIMREGGFRTTREQSGLMPIVEGETRGRVIDLVGVDPQGQGMMLEDTTVADYCRPGVLRSSAVQTGAAAREAEVGKRRKYHDHPQGDTFYAQAVETHGCLGEEFQRFLRRCAQRGAAISRGEIPEDRFATEEETGLSGRDARLLAYYRQRVAVALQRSQAVLIHDRAARALESSGLGGQAPAAVHVALAADLFTVTRVAGGSKITR
jgi:hypothetical protein